MKLDATYSPLFGQQERKRNSMGYQTRRLNDTTARKKKLSMVFSTWLNTVCTKGTDGNPTSIASPKITHEQRVQARQERWSYFICFPVL